MPEPREEPPTNDEREPGEPDPSARPHHEEARDEDGAPTDEQGAPTSAPKAPTVPTVPPTSPTPSGHAALARPLASRLAIVLVTAATVLGFVLVTARFRLQPDVAALLPDKGEAAALKRYVRGFGGGDLGAIMVRGPSPEENAAVASRIARELAGRESVRNVAARIDVSRTLDPMLTWRHANARARESLAKAMTPEGMRERLDETRTMLLAPGSGSLAERIQADPLRLGQLVFENTDVTSGVKTQADGAFATDDGTVQLVLAVARGQALRGADAKRFVREVESVLEPIRREHPGVRVALTGGHAIAAGMEEMLTRDLTRSSIGASIVASLLFALIFRRVRALVAVFPPLLLGTVWTAGLATLFPGGLSAIAVAFMSVVLGVGVDTGVHVYASLLEHRRAGHAPAVAARLARRDTWRPVLVAATTAGAAFGALALSDIHAMRQLGILCAAGEVLTAIAIVLVTPVIGAWLEKGPPPPPAPSRWTAGVAWLTATRGRAALLMAVALVPVVALLAGRGPSLGEAIVAIRPKDMPALKVQQEIFDAFGGKKGQWVVLVGDASLERARERADRVAERLGTMRDDVEAVDALTAIAPAPATQEARFRERDALDLPAKARELERALGDKGYSVDAFEEVLSAMKQPARTIVTLDDVQKGPAALLVDRYVGFDEGEHLVAVYVRPREVEGAISRIEAAVHEADAGAKLTGYSRLERSLRDTLSSDMPRIGLVAGILVLIALASSLRRTRDVLLAALVVACELAAVLVLIGLLGIPLHAYDALVLPVLLGITVDEGMFLLHRARVAGSADIVRETLEHEGPPIAATALTTAAGFGGLAFCEFDGLRDLGRVGALGSVMGLVVALVVVPAGLRLAMSPRRRAGATGST